MKTAVLYVSWNRLECTKITLEAYLKNTKYPHLLYIVDNGSTDESIEYLKELESKNLNLPFDIKFRYYRKNYGLHRIENLFIKEHRHYNYLGLVTNDAIVPEEWLNSLVDYLDNIPKIGFIAISDGRWEHTPEILEGRKVYTDREFYFCDNVRLLRSSVLDEIESKGISPYKTGNVYGVTEVKFYGKFFSAGYLLTVYPFKSFKYVCDANEDIKNSSKHKRHSLLVRRVYCRNPKVYQEETSGDIEYFENEKYFKFENEPENWYKDTEGLFEIVKSRGNFGGLDSGVLDEDINNFPDLKNIMEEK